MGLADGPTTPPAPPVARLLQHEHHPFVVTRLGNVSLATLPGEDLAYAGLGRRDELGNMGGSCHVDCHTDHRTLVSSHCSSATDGRQSTWASGDTSLTSYSGDLPASPPYNGFPPKLALVDGRLAEAAPDTPGPIGEASALPPQAPLTPQDSLVMSSARLPPTASPPPQRPALASVSSLPSSTGASEQLNPPGPQVPAPAVSESS